MAAPSALLKAMQLSERTVVVGEVPAELCASGAADETTSGQGDVASPSDISMSGLESPGGGGGGGGGGRGIKLSEDDTLATIMAKIEAQLKVRG